MSTTIVDDLQRATTAINKIQRAIERKTSESLDNVPVEEYDDIIKDDMPSLVVNKYTQQTITFENSIALDDNTTANDIDDKIDYSNMLKNASFNNDSANPDNSAKELIIELNITDSRSTQGPITGTKVNFRSAFSGLKGEGLSIILKNIASYTVSDSDIKFEDSNFTYAFDKVNEKLTLDDCDGKILVEALRAIAGTAQIATSDLTGVLRNAKGIYTSKENDDITLDLNAIFTLKASGRYVRVNNMLNGFTAPNTIVIAPSIVNPDIDLSTDYFAGSSEYANINVKSLTNVDLGYKDTDVEMYYADRGRGGHALYNSTINDSLAIIGVPGSVYYKNNSVPVSQLQSYLDLADVWDAVDFAELATAYGKLLQLGSDYQEGSTFTQGNVVVYKYSDQQLSGDESAITALGVSIVDIPRA